jgi:hypothetical protein
MLTLTRVTGGFAGSERNSKVASLIPVGSHPSVLEYCCAKTDATTHSLCAAASGALPARQTAVSGSFSSASHSWYCDATGVRPRMARSPAAHPGCASRVTVRM